MNKKPKCIFFIENQISYIQIIRSKLLESILEGHLFDVCIVLPSWMPFVEEECILKYKDKLTIKYLDIVNIRPSDLLGRILSKPIHAILRDLICVRHPDFTLAQYRAHNFKSKRKNLSTRLIYAKILNKIGLHWKYITRVFERFGHYPEISNLLDQEKPDLIIYFTFLLGQSDYLREAKRRKIPILLDLPNWDQASSKGPMSVIPDHAFLWSENIQRDFCRIHEFPSISTSIVGALAFDYYFQNPAFLSREHFCALHNIDPAKKIILYAYGRLDGIDTVEPMVEDIVDAIHDLKMDQQCHLLVRLSPRVAIPRFNSEFSNVSFQFPMGSLSSFGFFPDKDENMMRASTLFHSDVVITVFSTMLLDGLCLKKPVINFRYSCNVANANPNPMDRFSRYIHLIPACESSAFYMPYSLKELTGNLEMIFKNQSCKYPEGENLLHHIAGHIDGANYRRWLQKMDKLINSKLL